MISKQTAMDIALAYREIEREMTKDQIEPACEALLTAIKAEDEDAIGSAAMKLVAGALVSLNRIAWFLEQLVTAQQDANNLAVVLAEQK